MCLRESGVYTSYSKDVVDRCSWFDYGKGDDTQPVITSGPDVVLDGNSHLG